MKYKVQIDFEKNRLSFISKIDSLHLGQYDKIPFHLIHDKPAIETTLNGVKAQVLIDTGDRSAITVFKNILDRPVIERAFAG